MARYFIRFASTEEQLRRDLERGYSYRLYAVYSSAEAARESDLVEYYDVDPDSIVPMTDYDTGESIGYGFALDGLCGFGPFATAEEAEAEARERGGYNGVSYEVAGIFTGEYLVEADASDGQVFRAAELISVVTL